MKFHTRQMAGFTLVELLVSITLGLLVIAAVMVFAVSSVGAYADNMASSKMTGDLRTSMVLLVRELRRAGFDSASVSRTLTDAAPSKFTTVTVDAANECVVYEYDRAEGAAGDAPAAKEIRGIRRNSATSAMEMSTQSAACGSSAGWVPISDPKSVSVTKFVPKLITTRFCSNLAARVDPATGTTRYDRATGSVRTLSLCLKGKSARDATISRYVAESVRIRAEDVTFVMNSDVAACPQTADVLPTPAALNTDCASQ